jgi:hypothetical protein
MDEDEDDEAFLRKIIFPEEDRHLFTATPWRSEYRWFRSSNIVPLEQWRQKTSRVGEAPHDKKV